MNWKNQIQAFCIKNIMVVKYFRNQSTVMVLAGKMIDTFEAEFLSVVADCDDCDQDEEYEQQAQGHPDHTGHGQALCNQKSHTHSSHTDYILIPFTSSWTVTMSMPRSFSALNN